MDSQILSVDFICLKLLLEFGPINNDLLKWCEAMVFLGSRAFNLWRDPWITWLY